MKKISVFMSSLVLLLLAITIIACNKEVDIATNSKSTTPQIIEAEFKTGYYLNQKIEYQEIDGCKIFQGDIILNDNFFSETPQISQQGIGFYRSDLLWPNAIVYYTIDSNVPSWMLDMLNQAINHYHQNTKIRFIQGENPSGGTARISATKSSTSSASIGYSQSPDPRVRLGEYSLSIGTIIHELGHTLGLVHEHCSPYRDNYITIHFNNIIPGYEGNYSNLFAIPWKVNNFDFLSIMMYSPYSYSINGLPTITKKDGTLYPYQQEKLSTGDKNILSIMYNYKTVTLRLSNVISSQNNTIFSVKSNYDNSWSFQSDLEEMPEGVIVTIEASKDGPEYFDEPTFPVFKMTYYFNGWIDSSTGTLISSQNPYTFSLNKSLNLKAKWTAKITNTWL